MEFFLYLKFQKFHHNIGCEEITQNTQNQPLEREADKFLHVENRSHNDNMVIKIILYNETKKAY